MIPKKIAQKVLERDKHTCAFTGISSDRLVVHHRANRGMGGFDAANKLANLVTIDSIINGRLESDLQEEGTKLGFKISRYAAPESIPLFHAGIGEWVLLDNDGGWKVLDGRSF